MSRKVFLLISGIIGLLFGVYMIAAPAAMMKGVGAPASEATNAVLQAMGATLIAVSIMLLAARNDAGSPALRGLLLGGFLMHLLELPVDWVAYNRGIFTEISGIIPGTVVHVVLGIGFLYYLVRMKKPAIESGNVSVV